MTLDWGQKAEDGRRPSIADKATVDWAVLKTRKQSRDGVIRVREREFPSTRAHDRVPTGPSSSRQPQDDGKASEIPPPAWHHRKRASQRLRRNAPRGVISASGKLEALLCV